MRDTGWLLSADWYQFCTLTSLWFASYPLPFQPSTIPGFHQPLLLVPLLLISFQPKCCQLFELCLKLLTHYASTTSPKYHDSHMAEEEQSEDLVVCFKMLKNLTTKDFIDFANTSGELPIRNTHIHHSTVDFRMVVRNGKWQMT